MITEFNKKTIKEIADQIIEELQELGKEQNVEFSFNGGSFLGKEANLKLHIVLKNSDLLTQEEMDYTDAAVIYNLPKKGSEIAYDGYRFKLIGFRPRCIKNPVIAKMVKDKTSRTINDGKTYKLSIEGVKYNMNKS